MSPDIPSNANDAPDLIELRGIALRALHRPSDPSVPPHERDLVITAQDLLWLLDKVESPSFSEGDRVTLTRGGGPYDGWQIVKITPRVYTLRHECGHALCRARW